MRVRIDVDPQDILDEMDLDEFLNEVGEKKLKAWMEKRRLSTDIFASRDAQIDGLFSELRRAVSLRDFDELNCIIDSYERPKWRTPEACERDFLQRVSK